MLMAAQLMLIVWWIEGTVFTIRFPVQHVKVQSSQSSDAPGRFDDVPALALAPVGQISTNQENSHDQNSAS